jgi:hypothetical protein
MVAGIVAALNVLAFAALGSTSLRRRHPKGEFAEFAKCPSHTCDHVRSVKAQTTWWEAASTSSRSQTRRAVRSFEQPKNVALGLGRSWTAIQ